LVVPERFPLRLGEGEEREQLVAAFPKTGHDARATFGPHALETHVRARRFGTGGVRDTMKVIADLREGRLGALPLKVT
jgi:hypothetical protein